MRNTTREQGESDERRGWDELAKCEPQHTWSHLYTVDDNVRHQRFCGLTQACPPCTWTKWSPQPRKPHNLPGWWPGRPRFHPSLLTWWPHSVLRNPTSAQHLQPKSAKAIFFIDANPLDPSSKGGLYGVRRIPISGP